MKGTESALSEFVKNINGIYAGIDISETLKTSLSTAFNQANRRLFSGSCDLVAVFQGQKYIIEFFADQTDFLPTAKRWMSYSDIISAYNGAEVFLSKLAEASEGLFKQYDFERLAAILRDIPVYNTSDAFSAEAVTKAAAEEYIRNEPELSGVGSGMNEAEKQERIKGIRDWISFCLTVIGFILSVYSLVSTKSSDIYKPAIEVNNYYINELEINAAMLNEMSYRIVKEDNIKPRAKPDCSSKVTGHLRTGQVVMVSAKCKKWVEINWEDQSGGFHSGWVQEYRLMEFRRCGYR